MSAVGKYIYIFHFWCFSLVNLDIVTMYFLRLQFSTTLISFLVSYICNLVQLNRPLCQNGLISHYIRSPLQLKLPYQRADMAAKQKTQKYKENVGDKVIMKGITTHTIPCWHEYSRRHTKGVDWWGSWGTLSWLETGNRSVYNWKNTEKLTEEIREAK